MRATCAPSHWIASSATQDPNTRPPRVPAPVASNRSSPHVYVGPKAAARQLQ
ncbi:hypothetical protein TIFTF001_024652 [Ficus carica]|uniref:Uncharacterized protein n=1 Tax=Ficus carica TaxID=3494 RepID=A0AA88AW02_FICCA|nr:hypothetical protein TIFTF001_024652 [Ficus carica]